jgi:hypothetical protein
VLNPQNISLTCAMFEFTDPFSYKASGYPLKCKGVFVLKVDPTSLATLRPVHQIGPAFDAVNNDADEPINTLACEQNTPSLTQPATTC